MIVSASTGPVSAYYVEYAESYVYRRGKDGQKWSAFSKGLPGPSGTTITILAANPKTKGEMQPTTVAYSYQLIQVFHGENLILNRKTSIFYNLLGPLQLARSSK